MSKILKFLKSSNPCILKSSNHPEVSSTFASGKMVLISKIEIIGRNRRNRNNRATNRPRVPMKVLQSQIVGLYIPHAEVKKSR
jgi:hypothetical protein